MVYAALCTFDLTPIDRGLRAGMDNDSYNQILTGRSGFFDFGGFTSAPPPPAVAACVVEVINNVPVVSYSNFTNVSEVSIRRKGSFIGLSSAGTGTYEDTTAVPGVVYSYVVRSRPGGVLTDVACSPATISIVAAAASHVALNLPVAQSTTAFGGVATRAVDGNTDGRYNRASVTHTSINSNNPWWRVDLGATHNVSQINIFNRTDNCCSNRLNGAVVYVGNLESNNPADYTEIGTLNGGTSVQTFTGVNTIGRYVMVRINGTGTLSLAEVEVFGTPELEP